MDAVFGLGVIAFLLVGVGGFVLWLWALIDAIRTPDTAYRTGSQLIWVLVIVLANVIGAILYLAVERSGRSSSVV